MTPQKTTPDPDAAGQNWHNTDTEVAYCHIVRTPVTLNRLEDLQDKVRKDQLTWEQAADALHRRVQNRIQRFEAGKRIRLTAWQRDLYELVFKNKDADVNWLQIMEHHDENLAAPYYEDTFIT